VGLSVIPQHASICINHAHRIEEAVPCALKPANGQYDLEFCRQALKVLLQWIVIACGRQLQMLTLLFDTKVRGFEQLLQQNYLRASGGRRTHQLGRPINILRSIPSAGHLRRGH
jgi:hypothetical protein